MFSPLEPNNFINGTFVRVPALLLLGLFKHSALVTPVFTGCRLPRMVKFTVHPTRHSVSSIVRISQGRPVVFLFNNSLLALLLVALHSLTFAAVSFKIT